MFRLMYRWSSQRLVVCYISSVEFREIFARMEEEFGGGGAGDCPVYLLLSRRADQKQNQRAANTLDRYHAASGPHRPEGHPAVHPLSPSTVAQPMKYDIRRHYVVKVNHSPGPEEDLLSEPEVQIHPPHLRQKRNYTKFSLL